MTNYTLDAIDRQLLSLMQDDASLSVSELADKVGMTAPPCWRRVKRLKDEKILDRKIWLLNAEAVGLAVTVYANVQLTTHDSEATTAFKAEIQKLPEVQECYILLGQSDVLLKILVTDIKYYEEFFYRRLSQIPGVREVTSSVVMSEVKKTTKLPL